MYLWLREISSCVWKLPGRFISDNQLSGTGRVTPSLSSYVWMCLCVQGCKNRDHIVNIADEENCEEVTSSSRVLNDLLLHRDAVCVSNTPPTEGWASESKTLHFLPMVHLHFVCVCVCVHTCERTEDSPSAAEKVPDCDVLLEPTLLGALRGDGSTVSLVVFLYQRVSHHVICLILSRATSSFPPVFPFEKLESATGRTFFSFPSWHLLVMLTIHLLQKEAVAGASA